MARWPADNQSALLAFYGTPGPQVEAQLVPVVPPFKMYYEGRPVASIKFHKKAAGALAAALQEIWDHYGHDQSKIDANGISRYNGAYNPRFIRGSTSKWSNHAYGAAIDLNAEANGFGAGHGNIPQPVIDAFKRQGARWGGDYHGRTDPMHFEFCDAGYVKPVGLMDTDSDSDTSAEADENSNGGTNEPTSTPWYKKAWSWVSGGGVGALGIGGSWLSGIEPVTICIVLGFAFAVFCVVWFSKKGNGW